MPRIPTAGEDLRTRVPNARSNIVQMGDGGMGRAMQGAVANVQGIVQQEVELDNRLRFSLAESTFAVEQANLIESLDDGDYETYEKRFNDGIAAARMKASKLIKSQRDLQMWETQANKLQAGGALDLRQRAKARERDSLRAGVQASIASESERALRDGDLDSAVRRMQQVLIDAEYDGVISAVEREKMQREVPVSLATRRLDMMPPETRLGYLNDMKNAEVKLLPPDMISAMKEKTESEIRTLRNAERTEMKWAQEDAYELMYTQLDEAETPSVGLALLKSDMFASLSPSQKRSLTDHAESLATGFATVTDPLSLERIYNMAGKADFATQDLSEFRETLDRPTWERFRSMQLESRGRSPKSPQSQQFLSTSTMVNNRLDAMGLVYSATDLASDKDKEREDAQAMATRRGNFIELFQRAMTIEEANSPNGLVPPQRIEEVLNTLTDKAQKDGLFAYEVPIPPLVRKKYEQQFKQAGFIPSPLDIQLSYVYDMDQQKKAGTRPSNVPPPEVSIDTSGDVPDPTVDVRSGMIDRGAQTRGE